MTSTIEITDKLVEILNVDRLNDLIDGELSRNKRTERDGQELTDVVIVPLVNVHEEIVNEGVSNVNVFSPNTHNNMPDELKLQEIYDAIDELIEAYNNPTNYFNFEIESDSLITDERDQTFLNIRVRFYVES